jgi:hypothetical protein
MELKQGFAAFSALAFLTTVALLFVSAVVIGGLKILGEPRLERWSNAIANWLIGGVGLTRKILVVALMLIAGYSALLFGTSIGSREWTLAPGQEKYFCEIDCHIAYAVIGVKKLLLVGASADTTAARGIFYVVTVRTRFDEKTISPSRGDSPLEPSPRAILLVDGAGRAYSPSFAGGRILEVIGESGVPMTQQLRPGESYHTRVAFDVPRDARNLRLLIESPTQPGWIGKVLIGDENSVFHKHVFLALPA